jgi:hypothetical protein
MQVEELTQLYKLIIVGRGNRVQSGPMGIVGRKMALSYI